MFPPYKYVDFALNVELVVSAAMIATALSLILKGMWDNYRMKGAHEPTLKPQKSSLKKINANDKNGGEICIFGLEMNREKVEWWKRFWSQIIVVCSVLIVVQCVAYLSGYIDLSNLIPGSHSG